MANLRYYNNSAPFWDFIAGLEGKDFTNHPFFSTWAGQNNEDAAGPSNTRQPGPSNEADHDTTTTTTTERDTPMDDPEEVAPEEWSPWDGNGWAFAGPRGFMRGGRGRGGHGRGGFGRHHSGPSFPHGPHGFHNGPPPPPAGEHPPPPPPNAENTPAGVEGQHGPPPPFGSEHGHKHPHGGPGPHRAGWGGRGGRCGGRGRNGPPGWKRNNMPFDMSNLAEFFQSQIFGGAAEGNERNVDNANNGDFTPAVDIFDTEASFVIHVSLPGAKKEDIAVNWDAERSEVNITGVIHRPGDEEFLKTLALDERKVGAFSRKVRLGSRANPAQVDAEAISAKLEDGILRVNVPKEDKEFDVIHKIDIE